MWLEQIEDALVIHTMLFGGLETITNLRAYRAFLYLLGIELLERGVSTLFAFVQTPEEIRYAEFFGFEQTPFFTSDDQTLMFKDLLKDD